MQGTAQKVRHEFRADIEITNEIPLPPDWLSEEASAEWGRLVGHSQYKRALATIDRGMLAAYCTMWGKFVEAVKDGELPSATMIATMVNLAAKLGLNPSDRAKINMPSTEKPKSQWAALRTTPNAG
jgi:phage terminase small subunit